MDRPIPALADRAAAAASRLADADAVLLASHNDADGLTSAAIGAAALARAGIDHRVTIEDQLDADVLEGLSAQATEDGADVLFLTDFGSGQLDAVAEAWPLADVVVADHHQPIAAADAPTALEAVDGMADFQCHVNPLLVGIDGAAACSGATATYAIARELAEIAPAADSGEAAAEPPDGTGSGAGATLDAWTDQGATGGGTSSAQSGGSAAAGFSMETGAARGPVSGQEIDDANRDLAGLAVVGAVGDMQTTDGELVGANAAVAAEGEAVGVLETATDLTLFGRQTRPLPKLLAYADELRLPGVSGDRSGAARFLDGLDVELRSEDGWRRWAELSAAERQSVASALFRRAVERGVPTDRIDRVVGTTYTLAREAVGSELRDASEFSTLLNATARYDRAAVGLAVCLGDRDEALADARELLAEHRRNLSRGVEWVEEHGVTAAEHCQYIDAGDAIRPTILGIVAGMAMGADGVDRRTPIVAFADDGDERKVSARATPAALRRGVDLSVAMHEAASTVGGSGGGHTVAAGATIPPGTEGEFVAAVDDVLAEQLASEG